MPPELPNEQELNLKKRARRRLVGAIALVLLMVIVLPQVLEDRTAHTQQEAIKIIMPEAVVSHKEAAAIQSEDNTAFVDETAPALEEHAFADDMVAPEPALDNLIAGKGAESLAEVADKPVAAPVVAKLENKTPEVKSAEIKPVPVKPVEKVETKPAVVNAEPKKTEFRLVDSFTVQVGVYSDMENARRIQEQLKQAGYSPVSEKVTTAKGESVRLKAGSFKSREDAVKALDKLKSIGLPGMVIANN